MYPCMRCGRDVLLVGPDGSLQMIKESSMSYAQRLQCPIIVVSGYSVAKMQPESPIAASWDM